MAYPGSLSALALEAFGTYIYDLCSKLLLPVIVKSPNLGSKRRRLNYNKDKLISQINLASQFFQSLIADVPANLANDLTSKIIDNVDNWDFEVGNCKRVLEEEMFVKLVSGLIHPGATRIEPPQDYLDCSYIFPETVFCSAMCIKAIMKSVHSLRSLTALHVIHSKKKCDLSDISLPNQLIEFSGNCDDDGLAKIAETCRNLKYVNVSGSRGITNSSIDILLKMEHLEKLNICDTKITGKGVKRLAEGLCKKPENLKYLALTTNAVHHIDALKSFPNLKLSLNIYSMLVNTTIEISELISFKNICGLQIHCKLDYINKLLKEIGGQLVYLDVAIEYFEPQNYGMINNMKASDVLQVGQFCSSLKCLHIEITYYNFPSLRNLFEKPLRGFQTVCCLTLEIKDKLKSKDFVMFLFLQCLNVKKMMLAFDKRIFNMYSLLSEAVTLGFIRQIEVIYFHPICQKCSLMQTNDVDTYSHAVVCETVEMLVENCPNLRVIGGACEMTDRYPHNSQRLKFFPSWCRCK